MKKSTYLIGIILISFLLKHDTYGMADVNEVMKERYEEIIHEEKSYLGDFTITFYCGCSICNGKWTGLPATNGEELKANYTIAVDPKVIPLDTFIKIDGFDTTFKACDTGSAIKGNKIDVYVSDHQEALRLGKMKEVKVWELEID